jgi:translation elongation factor EF-G
MSEEEPMYEVIEKMNKELADEQERHKEEEKKLRLIIINLNKEKDKLLEDRNEIASRYEQDKCSECGGFHTYEWLCEKHFQCEWCCQTDECQNQRFGVGNW